MSSSIQPSTDGVPCETCGETFPTQQGMRSHHTQKHGESLTNSDEDVERPYKCKTCGDRFKSRRGMRSHHTQKHGVRVDIRICAREGCNDPITGYDPDQQYCSPDCSQASKRSGQVAITCACCYKTFYVPPSHEERYVRCSPRCRGIAQRCNFGEGDKLRRYTRPGTFKELVRHVYAYEGHSFEALCRIVDVELDDDYSREEISEMVSELMSHERNVRNRVWALRPEDLGLSPIGEVAQ